MKRFLLTILLWALIGVSPSFAQNNPSGQLVQGSVQNKRTVNGSVVIASGNTFQNILTSVAGTSNYRSSITIQNNNTNTDNCFIFIGSGTATAGTSIKLSAGGSYQRYWPNVPSDLIQATCDSTSDTLYVDTQ